MGGASLGYINSGHKVIIAIDNWEDALNTHIHNIKDTPVINSDINALNLDNLPHADIYHFSPPCQSFSTAGKLKGFNCDNGNLFMISLKIIKTKKPNIFVIENVKGLLSHLKNTDLFKEFYDYCVTPILVNAKDCGVCQSRERVLIVGIKKEFGMFNIPPKIKNVQTFKTVIEAVKDNNFGIPKHSKSLIDKIKYIPQGGCVLDIPEKIRPKSFKNSYSRLYVDKIPPTITRNYNCPSSANCIHPYEHRGLSDAEALYIQGFPRDWEVKGKKKNLQIGNAVPPKVIEWLMSGISQYTKE